MYGVEVMKSHYQFMHMNGVIKRYSGNTEIIWRFDPQVLHNEFNPTRPVDNSG